MSALTDDELRLTDEQRDMVEANLGLVGWVINRNKSIPEWRHDDAFQDGVFGLMRAAQKYDPTKGYTFSTYAHAWIRQAIQRGHARAEGIPLSSVGRGSSYVPPLSLDWVYEVAHVGVPGQNWEVTLTDYITDDTPGPDEHAEAAATLAHLRLCAAGWLLDDRDRAIVDALLSCEYPSHGRLCNALAPTLGISHQAVRTRLVKILARLRKAAA